MHIGKVKDVYQIRSIGRNCSCLIRKDGGVKYMNALLCKVRGSRWVHVTSIISSGRPAEMMMIKERDNSFYSATTRM